MSQKKLKKLLHFAFIKFGIEYQKNQAIYARTAEENEQIITKVDGKQETINTANKGDYIIKNLTTSQEQYIIPRNKFSKRYIFLEHIDALWNKYLPQGRVKALEVNQYVLRKLNQHSPFCIEAPWGEKQYVERGDQLVCPLPQENEIYRIAASAFKETYQPILFQ